MRNTLEGKYRVFWEFKNPKPGCNNRGYGSPISKECAEAAADAGNKQQPEIHHWVVPATDSVVDFIVPKPKSNQG